VFYCEGKERKLRLRDIAQNQCWEGVGALPLVAESKTQSRR
jgi:hypothetical protein